MEKFKDRSLKTKDINISNLIDSGMFNKTLIAELFNELADEKVSRMSFFNKVSGKQEFSDTELVVLKEVFNNITNNIKINITQSDINNKRKNFVANLSNNDIDELINKSKKL